MYAQNLPNDVLSILKMHRRIEALVHSTSLANRGDSSPAPNAAASMAFILGTKTNNLAVPMNGMLY